MSEDDEYEFEYEEENDYFFKNILISWVRAFVAVIVFFVLIIKAPLSLFVGVMVLTFFFVVKWVLDCLFS